MLRNPGWFGIDPEAADAAAEAVGPAAEPDLEAAAGALAP